jgi:hypothetical protein
LTLAVGVPPGTSVPSDDRLAHVRLE